MEKEIRGELSEKMEKRKVKKRNQNFVKGRCIQIKRNKRVQENIER
jgi:hypothetical protein